MTGEIDLGNAASWIQLLVIGIVLTIAIDIGLAPDSLSPLSTLLIVGPIVLGAVYFILDLNRKF